MMNNNLLIAAMQTIWSLALRGNIGLYNELQNIEVGDWVMVTEYLYQKEFDSVRIGKLKRWDKSGLQEAVIELANGTEKTWTNMSFIKIPTENWINE